MEEGNILDLQERKDEERRKIREEKARLARHAAIQVGPGPGLCDTICWHHPARQQRLLCIPRALAWGRIRASLGNGVLPPEMEVPRSGFLLCSCQALASHSELVKTVLVSV